MNIDSFVSFLQENEYNFALNECMKAHTSFKIGGAADIFVSVCSKEELSALVCRADQDKVPVFILGKGSNLLVSDNGIEGAVVSLSNLNYINVQGEILTCGAGASLSAVCRAALANSLTGIEFAYGIPGSIGGALYMNAGAYGGEMSQIVAGARVMKRDGSETELSLADMQLGYRTSLFKNGDYVIIEVVLRLEKGNYDDIKAKMDCLTGKRCEKQPLEYPSAGSTFKRPEGNFAGTLIEKNGLKGARVGGAMVSEKHAGFIINMGNATCKDVLDLIKKIQQTVKERDGILLQPEVLMVGRE